MDELIKTIPKPPNEDYILSSFHSRIKVLLMQVASMSHQ